MLSANSLPSRSALPPQLLSLTPQQLRLLAADLTASANQTEAETRLSAYRAYAKQQEFHAAGATHRERLLMAGNQLGKTIAGGAEAAMHLTGLYPDWWEGRRFNRPTHGWASSVTNEATRDNVQAKLIGPPEIEELRGTGFIPKARLLKVKPAAGTPNLLDSATVRHVSGGLSTVGFKSYAQGREKWQGPTKDWMWWDEEPPLEIYTEGLARMTARADAVGWLTFTPLLGMSEVVRLFLGDDPGI